MNGVKGTEFTILYIERFHKMEESLSTRQLPQDPMELLKLHYQAIKQVDGKAEKALTGVEELREQFNAFEKSLPLLPNEADEVSNAVKNRVVEVLGGKDSPAYKNRERDGLLDSLFLFEKNNGKSIDLCLGICYIMLRRK